MLLRTKNGGYLHTKFQFSDIILMRFRQGLVHNHLHSHYHKKEPLKFALRSGQAIFSSPYKMVRGAANKIVNPSKTNTSEDSIKTIGVNNVYGGGRRQRKAYLKNNHKATKNR